MTNDEFSNLDTSHDIKEKIAKEMNKLVEEMIDANYHSCIDWIEKLAKRLEIDLE